MIDDRRGVYFHWRRLGFLSVLLVAGCFFPVNEGIAAAFYDCLRSTARVGGQVIGYVDTDCHRVFETGEFGGGGGGWGASGGGGFTGNRGDRQDVQDASEKDCPERRGNPIVVTTGNKIEPEVDFESSGEAPLTLRRTYNSFWKYPGLFGRYWVSSFDYSLVWQTKPNGGNPITVIFAQRPDGRRILFVPSGTTDRWNENKPQPVAYILKNADGSYTHYSEDLPLETYDGGGRPLTIKNRQGIGWTFSYANNFLSRVTHTSGRFVQFGWSGGQLTQVTAPDGSVFSYTYTANAFGAGKHRLATAVSPAVVGGNEATSVEYFYENTSFPGALTGKAYGGVRYSRFEYDAQRRATLSEHVVPGGGVDKYTFSYSGTEAPPTNPPRDPPGPGETCNPVTHICTPPVLIEPGAPPLDDPEIAANEAAAANEATAIDAIMATVITTETNPYGKITKYTATDGRLTSVVGEASAHCARRVASISYDTNGYENLVKDFNGNTVDYDYNAKGQLTQKVEGSGSATPRTTTYAWDPTYNRMTRETVVGDHETAYVYGADHRLASVTIKNLASSGVANETHKWTYTYTKYASGIVQTMVVDGPQAAQDQITYDYAATGDLASVKNTLNHTTSFASYNGLGQPGRMTGPNGDITDYAYYPGGRPKEAKTYPNGTTAASTRYTYGYGVLFTVTTPDNITTWLAYDQARRLIRITRNELQGLADRRITYNAASDPTSEVIYRGDGVTLRYQGYTDYDELGRVIARRGNDGQNVRYGYDLNDNLASVTDSLNRVTSFTYDALNRLSTQTDAKSGVTRYEYDLGGRVKKVTDPRSLVTTYAYDGFGQLRTQGSPDSSTTTYGYTASGFLSAMTRANGQATAYAYDGIGRLTSATASGKSRVYGYDWCINGKGRLCNVDSPDNVLHYQYELDGRVRARRDLATVGGVQSDFTTIYGYDSVGRLTRITYPNGAAANYAYTTGQLSAMTLTIGATTTNLISDVRYQPFGVPAGYTLGNGLVRRYAYDLGQRLTSLSTQNGTTALQSLTYAYNANDQITQIANGVSSALTESYGYDELSRLKVLTADGGSNTFVYDANGNRTSASNGWAHTIATTSNRMTGTNAILPGSSFGYDGAGNTLNYTIPGWGVVNYNYDAFNQMQSMTGPGTAGTYGYNGYGERTTKNAPHGRYRYQYGEDHRLLSEYSDSTGVWTNYLWFGGERIGILRGTATYYLHNDHLGRPELATNASRTKVWQVNNDAFGGTTGNPSIDSIGGLNVRLPGQYFDAELGLFYNVNRYYDSVHSRYWQADPIGLAGGSASLYIYVGGNPVSFVDPLGLAGCYVGFPGYPITIPGTDTRVPLTHAGVLSYDSQGSTRYYEYGRYDSDFGNVRRQAVPDLTIGPDGKPTADSWAKMQKRLSEIGHGTGAKTSCDANADADKINNFAEQRMNDPNRAPYSWSPFSFNTCTSFASDALAAGR